MDFYGISRVLRVENCHFDDIVQRAWYADVVKALVKAGFTRSFGDDWIESYSRPEFTDKNKNTLVYFDTTGRVLDIRFYVRQG